MRLAAILALLSLALGWYVQPMLRHHRIAAFEDAPAEVVAPAPVQPRGFYGRRLEPKENVVLHGAGQTDLSSFTRYSAAVAPAKPVLFMTYVDLRDDLPAYFARLRSDLDKAEPELIVPQIGLSLNRGTVARHYEAETAAGKDDASLAQLCNGLRLLDRPVFLRIGYEFNAPWNGYEAASYQAAFRRIVNTVRGCGLQNVAAVWNWSVDAELDAEAGGAASEAAMQRAMAFYPGDDAVDWWALNLFSTEGMRAEASRAFLKRADASKHPVMIAESTPKGLSVASTPDVLDRWYRPYFNLIAASPGIKAFCYIDWDWRKYPQWAEWGDARIESAPAVLQWYRAEVAKPVYAGARSRIETEQLLRVTRPQAQ